MNSPGLSFFIHCFHIWCKVLTVTTVNIYNFASGSCVYKSVVSVETTSSSCGWFRGPQTLLAVSKLQAFMPIKYTIMKEILKASKINVHLSLCQGKMDEPSRQQRWCTIAIPAFERWKQEDRECRAILSHIGRPARSTWDLVLKN